MVTDKVVAALFMSIVMPLASELGVGLCPLAVAVMISASASYATPGGYQTKTLFVTVPETIG